MSKVKRIAGDLTTVELKTITDKLVKLREQIRATGRTALSPTPEWDKLRKEIAVLNRTLNSDTSAKTKTAAVESAVDGVNDVLDAP